MKSTSSKANKGVPGPAELKRMIEKVRKDLSEQIRRLRDELHASDLALAAARLRLLNETQTHEGAGRLRADLQALHDLGIVDRNGNRLRKDWPASKVQGASDVV